MAQCRHPDGGRKTAQSAWRTTHDSKRNRGAGHARLNGARPSSLVPRSPFLRPSFLLPRSSVPPSLGPRWLPLRAAQNDGRGQRCKQVRGPRCRSLHAGRADSRGVARVMRRVRSSDDRAGSGPGESTPSQRYPPSPPPRPPARRTQQSRLHIAASADSCAARGRAASGVLPRTQWRAVRMRAPRRRSSPPPSRLHKTSPPTSL